MISWLLVALLGGAVALDTTSFPQMMISRPLVAGTLTGAVFGRPAEGLLVGLIMEAYALLVLPVGASRYPESGPATVAAASAYLAVAGSGVHPDLLALVAFGLVWEWVAGGTVILQRRANGKLLLEDDGIAARTLERRHLSAMGLDFLRGGVLAAAGGIIAAAAIGAAEPLWGLGDAGTAAALTVLATAMLGTAAPMFGGLVARKYALLAGAAVGAAVVGAGLL